VPELLRPFWIGDRVEGESVLFIKNTKTAPARASVLFPVCEVLSVRSSAGDVTYESGRDYVWKPGSREIVLPAGSRIPSRTPAQMRRPAKSQQYQLTHRDGNGEIFFGGRLEYAEMQTCVTYTHGPNLWKGPVPKYDRTALPRSIDKLIKKQPLSIVTLGDSISAGANASALYGAAPYQPAYPELLAEHLAAHFRGKVTMKNLAVGGTDTSWGLTQIDKVVAARPDLVILAFGMNDSAGRPAKDYQANTKGMIAKIRTRLPDCEFILVASMLGNRDWVRLRHELFPQYRDALKELVEPGVAVADLTSIWSAFLDLKRDRDQSGNGVNHPNDFGHRVYAQVISTLFIDGLARKLLLPPSPRPNDGRSTQADDRGLLGHWKLAGDTKDSSGMGNHGVNHGADMTAAGPDGKPRGAARFDGIKAYIQVPPSPSLNLGADDFTLGVWVHTDAKLDDVLGDLVSKYDSVARRGVNWCIKNGAGATNSQSNYRNVHFGIDAGSKAHWTDCGRPGNAVYVMALAVHDGQLFAGTCEPGKDETGHVYRYAGGTRWVDCGRPDTCNAVTALAVHGGSLYAGTGKYRLAGSSLQESTNLHLGGKIVRYDGHGKWIDCGRLPGTEAVGGMVVYRGDLYAASLYKPAGFFRYKGGADWVSCPLPSDGKRVVALGVYNGYLYATSYDACAVYRFDGASWTHVGTLEASGQTYSFEVHRGELYVGTWPNGRVFRYQHGIKWIDAGRLGQEKEVMGMAVHNGKLYAGTLPSAAVYRYEGGTSWMNTGRLDFTPDVRYRRAWSMAVFRGRLFCGTLPSGHVHALTAGPSVTLDRELKPGWRHLAAVRHGSRLELFVDGKLIGVSEPFDRSAFNLTNDQPLTIGFGAHDYFRGRLSDLRLYGRALSADEIAQLAMMPGGQ
jgi:lysophospholipase L1-like esterase